MEEMRSFGYICPKCGKAVLGSRSAFALQAAAARITCECGESEMEIQTDGTRFRLWVPCGLCGGEHHAEVDAKAILTGRGVGLACPEALYCIAADESELYDGYSDESGYSEPVYDFDRAYVWQPQTPQDDGNYDVRDIAFYLKDGTVSVITMTKPYAFRFAYGVDCDAALRLGCLHLFVCRYV